MSRGKREKERTPTLHSYILSLVSLVLCCAMFMSATMAWFTSEVTTTGIRVYAGTLDVALRDTNNASLHGQTGVLFNQVYLPPEESGVSAAAVGESENAVTHWQDGAEAFARLQVVNEGDLAFAYSLYLTVESAPAEEAAAGNAENTGENVNLTDYFEVWYKEWQESWPEAADGYIGNLQQDGWTKVTVGEGDTARDTLTAILEEVTTTDENGTAVPTGHGTPVFTGTMTAAEIAAAKENETEAAHRYTVALRMKSSDVPTMIEVDDTGTATTLSIMGRTITLSVKLVASQIVDTTPADETDTGSEPGTDDPAAQSAAPDTDTTEDATDPQSAEGNTAANSGDDTRNPAGNAAENGDTEKSNTDTDTQPTGSPVSM